MLGLSNVGFVGVWVARQWFGCCLGCQTLVSSVFGLPGSGLVAASVVKRWFRRCLGRQAVVWFGFVLLGNGFGCCLGRQTLVLSVFGSSNTGFVGVRVVS